MAYSVGVFWLLKAVSLGFKWARTVLTNVLILAMFLYPLMVFQPIKTNLIQITLLATQYVLQIYSIVLLYNKEFTEWLNSLPVMKPRHSCMKFSSLFLPVI